MGWWKCSVDLYASRIMHDIVQPIHPRDGFMPARESIFMRLLSFCASEHVFWDVKQFSRLTTMPIKQCQIVWDICVKHNVLRKTDNGYTAIDWLKENGLLETATKGTRGRPITRTQESDVSTAEQHKTETTQNTPEIPTQPHEPQTITQPIQTLRESPRNNYSKKFPVRDNVFLLSSELEDLKEQYSDEEISLMLDRLSEYKRTSNRNYKSDYQAIRRWVINWLKTSQDKKIPITESEFPNWLTGKGNENDKGRN